MIFIAGGAGYIGSHTNKMLSREGYETCVFDNLVSGHKDFVKWGKFFEGDLADKKSLRDCFKQNRIEAVMHFSAFAYVGESVLNPAKYYINNVANTLNLLEVMVEFGVKMFVFSSTCATYGLPQTEFITEEHQQNPISPYGKSKLMVENILKDFNRAYGIEYVNLRYFNAAGADPEGELGERHNPETHLIPLTILAALGRRDSIQVFGTDYPTKDGTCVRDYIHVADLADAHILALEQLMENKGSGSFNLSNARGHSIREIIEQVKAVSKNDFKVVDKARRAGDPPILVGDATKAKSVLGWNPKFDDISAIVKTAWNWHTKDSC